MGNPNQPTGPIQIWPPPAEMERKRKQARHTSVVAFVLAAIAAIAGFAGQALLAGAFAAGAAVVVLIVIAILGPIRPGDERSAPAAEDGR